MGSILSENILNVTQTQCSTHVKRVSQHSAESRGFTPALSDFLPQVYLYKYDSVVRYISTVDSHISSVHVDNCFQYF